MDTGIFLVGPMGAGKSAVGRQLARILKLPFRDADTWIEKRTGVDIAYIFEIEGEAGFRKRESDAIDTLTSELPVVLATGGGAIMDRSNREKLGARGLVVYLHATVEQQWERVQRSTHRPLLDRPDPRAVLENLFAIRDPLYREIADIVFDTDGQRVTTVAAGIAERLAEQYDGIPSINEGATTE